MRESKSVVRAGRRRRMVFLLFALLPGVLAFTGLTPSPAAAVPVTVVDDGGPDDLPGQKDLNQLTTDVDSGIADIVVTWNWDVISRSGNNTVDACSLYDTDNDGMANFSLCVIWGSNAVYQTTRLYSCGDGAADKCVNPRVLLAEDLNGDGDLLDVDEALVGGPYNSTCSLSVVGDTFGPRGGAQADTTSDVRATCLIELDDFGGVDAFLLNVCSYPSQIPGSDPSDCVVNPANGFLTIVKSADPDDGTTFQFDLGAGQASTGGETSFSINGSGSIELIGFAAGTGYDLTEVVPATFELESAQCVLSDGTPTGTLSGDTVNDFEIQTGRTTTCTFTNGPALQPPAIVLVKTADSTTVDEPGGPVTFTVEVTNNGGPGTINSLVDDIHGDLSTSCLDGGAAALVGQSIDTGQTLTCTFSAEVTGNAGESETDTVTAVVSNDAGSDEASDTATVTINDVPASIAVSKTASPSSVDEPGGDVTYTFTVDNTSATDSVTINSLQDSIYGDLNGQNDCSVPQTIVEGAGYSCSITTFVSGNPGEIINNVLSVAGEDDDGNPVGGSADADVTVNDVPSSITVTKTASPTSVPESGGDVTYTFVVTNDSAVDSVTIATLDDSIYGDLNGQNDCSVPQTIAAGGSYSCSITVNVSGQADDTVTNIITASGTDDDGNPVSASDSADVTIIDVPSSIVVEKTASPTSVPEPGGDVTFTFVVDNTSVTDDVTINSLSDSIYGDLNGQGTCSTPQTIAAGGSYSCAITAFVAGNAGDVIPNVLTVSGTDDDGDPVGGTDDAGVEITDVPSSISVDKTASPTSVPETGGDVTYTVVVTNTSEVDTVTINQVIDDRVGDVSASCNDPDGLPVDLAPTESMTCEFSDFVSGDTGATYTNVATVFGTDDDGNPVQDDDTETVTFDDVDASIEIIKTATPASVPEPGGNVTFSFVVNNTSAVDLVTITSLADSVYGDITAVAGSDCSVPQTLLVGGSYSCSFTAFVAGNAGDSETNVVTASGVDDDGETVTDDDDATVTLSDVPSSILTTKTASPGSVPESGGDVTFTIEVENTSTVDAVTINTVTDTVFGDVSGSCAPALPAVLSPGESITCSFTEFISGDFPDSHVNVATASGEDDDGNPVSDDDDAEVPFNDVFPEITVTKTADPTSVPETGGDVTFTFVATNNATEDATLDSMIDSDFGDLNTQGDCVLPQPLAASGGSYTCSITVFLSGDAGGPPHNNVVTATASDDDGNTTTDEDDETVTFDDVLPDVSITKTADPTSVPETGGDVEFTIVVTNNSAEDATIDSLTDTDFDLAVNCADAVGTVLGFGDTYTCVFTEFVEGDFSGPAHENTATVVASDGDGNSDTESDDETVGFEDVLPTITVTKTADPVDVPETGGDVEFTIVVTNTGDEDVTIDSLTDTDFDLSPECDDAVGTVLAPDATYSCTFTRTLAGDASGTGHENTATAEASDNEGNPVVAGDDAVVGFDDVEPDITLVKTAEPSEVPETGADVVFTYEVTNNSLEDATLVSLTDTVFGDLNGEGTCSVPQPLPGDNGTYTCQITRFISGDFGGPPHMNTGTATASDNEGNEVTDEDDETVDFTDVLPDVSITKTTDPTSVDEPGADVTFTIVVTNNSLEDATIDTLIDTDFPLAAHCPDAVGTVLGSGDTYTCVFTEFVAGNVGEDHENQATVVASDDDGNFDTESDDASVTIDNVDPAIEVVKDGPATIGEGGDTATYKVTITNNSVSSDPVTITSLIDDKYGDLLPDVEAANGGPITIDPGASFAFSFDRDLTLDVDEEHTNVITACGDDDEGVPACDDDDHTVTGENVEPVIAVDKTGPATIDEGGDTATYEVTITNNSGPTDPVTITSLSDDKFGDLLAEAEASNGGPIEIAPGDSFTFDFTGAVDLDAGETHTNTVTAVGTDDEGSTDQDSDDHVVTAVDVAPILNIVKTGPDTVFEGGDTATYTITIRNDSVGTDPVTITSLSDDKFGDLLPDAETANGGPIVLNPGEEFTFSFDRDLTLDAGAIHINVAEVCGLDDEDTEDCDDDDHPVTGDPVDPAIEVTKDGPAVIDEGGDTATYTVTITNNSVSTDPVTITSLSDDRFGDLLGEAEAANGGASIVIQPGESFSFDFDRELTLNGGESHINIVTACADDDEGVEACDDDDHEVTGDPVAPVIDVLKDGPAAINEGGDTATYSVTITNNSVGTDPVEVTSIDDDKFGNLLPEAEAQYGGSPIVLNPGDSFTFTFDRPLELDAGDSHINVVTVCAVDDEGVEACDDDDHEVDVDPVNPILEIIKEGDAVIGEGGDTAAYSITITNDSVGTDPVTITSLMDDKFGDLLPEAEAANGDNPIVLQPGESFTFGFERDLIVDVGEDHTNMATVCGVDDEGTEDCDDDDHTVTGENVEPQMEVTKTPSQDEVFAPGEDVTFTIRVENDSVATDPLTITSIVDDVFGDVSADCLLPQTIAANGVFECDITRSITADHTNTATILAEDDEGTEISAEASAAVVVINPSLSIEKSTNGIDADSAPGPGILVGSAVSWTYEITNDGDVPLTGIEVVDDILGPICTIDSLAAGDTATCNANGTAAVGGYANVGTASTSYTDVDGDTAERSASDPSHYFGADPSLEITKAFADDTVSAGGAGSSFDLVVTNDGNVDLTGVSITDVVDDRLTVTGVSGVGADCSASTGQNVDCVADIDSGESVTITVEFSVAADVAEADAVSNTATASTSYTDGSGNTADVSDEATDTIDIAVDIDLSMVKTFDPSEATPGAAQSFTLVVTNSGPSDAVDVSVTDVVADLLPVTAVSVTAGTGNCDASSGQSVDCTVQVPAGESVTITVDYVVTPFLDADTGNLGGDDFRFVFVNGSVLEGSTATGEVYLDGVDVSDDVDIITGLSRNDLVFDPPGPDPAFELHLSCSDPFTGGWGQSGGPVEGVDTNWQIAYYSIVRYNNNGFVKECSDVTSSLSVPNEATASAEDSSGTETTTGSAVLTIGPGITVDRLQTNGKRLTVSLTNGTTDKTIEDISVAWPDSNGNLTRVRLDDSTVWAGDQAPPNVLLDATDSGWNGGTLPAGEGVLRFDFKKKSANTGYTIQVTFTDGTVLDISQ